MAFGYGFYMKDGEPMPRVLAVDPEQERATRKASKKNLRNQMKEENVIDSKCSVCRRKNKGIKKCNGCYSTWYCGQKCQREDWPNHRDQCQKIKSQYRIAKYKQLFIQSVKFTPTSITRSDVREANNNLIKKHFVVRIKLLENEILKISNQDHSFQGLLSKTMKASTVN